MSDPDFVETIRISAYWRKQLGEYEFINYNADDLRRWFVALETRGPAEIRNYIAERYSRYPTSVVTGIVSLAPHPPLTIVQIWLASRQPVRTAHYWTALVAFCMFVYLAATNLQGCTVLVDPNQLLTQPPQMNAPLMIGSPGPLPSAASTLPNPGPAPASVASPPTGSIPSQQ